MKTLLQFKEGEQKNILITYKSNYERVGDFVSYGDMSYSSYFKYLLSSGSGWHGPISKGIVNIYNMGEHIYHFEPEGKFVQKSPSHYQYSFTALEPKPEDDIQISIKPYSEQNSFGGVIIPPALRRGDSVYRKIKFSANASSTLQGYPIKHIQDESYRTAWVEGKVGNGIGESVVLSKFSTTPHQIAIYPGYGKSRKLYYANNRIKSLDISINQKPPFKVHLDDKIDPWHIIELPVTNAEINRIEVTISDVYKGTQYQDTAISRLELREVLTRDISKGNDWMYKVSKNSQQ